MIYLNINNCAWSYTSFDGEVRFLELMDEQGDIYRFNITTEEQLFSIQDALNMLKFNYQLKGGGR